MSATPTYVVVGAGLAGGKAVETLRGEGFDGRIVLVGAEPERPYERPPLSKGVLLGTDEDATVFVHDEGWYTDHDVELRLGAEATRVDPGAQELELGDGSRLAYDKLLLATGASPRRLRVPGADLDGVMYLRTLGDSQRLRSTLAQGVQVVVIGAGWIGLEVAAAARQYGCPVTVLEPEATALAAALGPEMGQVFADLHRDHGVDLRFGRLATELGGSDGKVANVRTDDGEQVPADLVVIGVGVAPNTAAAEAGGLTVDDGIVTDAALRTSAPGVFAVGDVARWQHPFLGRSIRVEHWANAHDGGPVAARSMLDQPVAYDVLPFFYSDQYDLGMEYSGAIGSDGYDEVVVRGDLAGREFCAFWLQDGRVLAGMNVNVWDVQDDIQALIKSKKQVSTDRLTDPDVPLGEL